MDEILKNFRYWGHKLASIPQNFKLSMSCIICQTRSCTAVCSECVDYFPKLETACSTCASLLPDQNLTQCGQCILHPPALDLVITSYQYAEPLRKILHQFKFYQALYLASFLSQLMLTMLPKNYTTECIVPVPIHTKRLRERGYHQTLLLARLLAKKLNCPIEPTICTKIIHTSPQAQLKLQQRQKNLRNAYHIKSSIYQHITLVDDLITTGHTANEIARQFKKSGVKRVDLWCCAKTLL